jgi:hypothetical protein
MKAIQFICSTIFMIAMSANAFAQAAPAASPKSALPDRAGKPIVERACAGCHSLKVIVTKKATRDDWTTVVNEMVTRGADLSDDEIDTVIEYLSTNFKPDDAKIEQTTQLAMTNLFQPLGQLPGVGPIVRRRAPSLARYMTPFPEMQFRNASPGDHINYVSH